ncbi:MAG TPA: sugar phosphate isomerase/epimerase [Steroidobacteraceae bacterium]|nr:sugar phosphate isomerase/epimerase [Steroidobacteraceae bacterium]
MNTQVDLLASYWTLAVGAVPHTGPEFSAVDFRVRVEQAARAGFTGMGLWHADLEHTLRRYSLADMKRILADNGIRHVELEFLTGWFNDGEEKAKSDVTKKLLFEAAAALEARAIKVGDFLNQRCPFPKLIDRFAGLCREAEDYGTRIAFEMMPFSIIGSLEDALALATGAAARNGGIFFDLWHVVKLDIPYEKVANFPAQYRVGMEINDGFSRAHSMPDMVEETTAHRQLCGEGEFDVKGFVAAIRASGWTGPWGIEVLNRKLREEDIHTLAPKVYRTTIAQF